jgi:hypothetical protein
MRRSGTRYLTCTCTWSQVYRGSRPGQPFPLNAIQPDAKVPETRLRGRGSNPPKVAQLPVARRSLRSYCCQLLTTPRLIQAGREPVDDLLCFSEPYARVELPITLDRFDLPTLLYQCCHILLGSWRCLTETVATPELPRVVQLASRQEQPCSTEETFPGLYEDADDDPGHAPSSQNDAKPIKPACPVSVRPRRSAFLHRRKMPRSAHSKRSFGRCGDRIASAQVPTVRCLGSIVWLRLMCDTVAPLDA